METGLTLWKTILIAVIPGMVGIFLGSILGRINVLKAIEKKFEKDISLKERVPPGQTYENLGFKIRII